MRLNSLVASWRRDTSQTDGFYLSQLESKNFTSTSLHGERRRWEKNSSVNFMFTRVNSFHQQSSADFNGIITRRNHTDEMWKIQSGNSHFRYSELEILSLSKNLYTLNHINHEQKISLWQRVWHEQFHDDFHTIVCNFLLFWAKCNRNFTNKSNPLTRLWQIFF